MASAKPVVPFFRTPYNYNTNDASDETAIHCKEPTLTQQHMADDCDINKLMEKYMRTGELPQLTKPPLQGDFTEVHTYQEALNLMIEARQSFMALPARTRSRFDNDPALFVDFCSREENRDEMRQMGLWSPEANAAFAAEAKAAKDSADLDHRDAEAYRKANKATPSRGARGRTSSSLDVTSPADTKSAENKYDEISTLYSNPIFGYGVSGVPSTFGKGAPMRRSYVNKRKSAGKFRRQSARTKGANLAPPPMRGGYRL